MPFDFDQVIERAQTHSQKFDGREQYFGKADVIPLWVADMDFAAPPCVLEAVSRRAEHPIYGYTHYPESLFVAQIEWFWKRHQWKIERDWILMMPGVVPSLHACCLALAEEGEGVIIQTPVYHPFYSTVTTTRRRLLLNPLRNVEGRYEMDFDALEASAVDAKMILLCTPHNPIGRVWTKDELIRVLSIAQKHDLLILSDDIHADIVFSNCKHHMLGTFEAEFSDFIRSNVITAVAPSKTFNIPGMGLSSLIVPNAHHRKRILDVLALLHVGNYNPFSIEAYEAAYRNGAEWLDALLVYLENNQNFVRDYMQKFIPNIRVTPAEGTYLLWLDCRELGLSDAQLKDFFIQRCGLGLSPGSIFGIDGKGFMRLNIGTRKAVLEEALERLNREVRILLSQ